MAPEGYTETWRMFDCRDDDGNVHIAPGFGREHELDEDCWCHPEACGRAQNLLIHNVEH